MLFLTTTPGQVAASAHAGAAFAWTVEGAMDKLVILLAAGGIVWAIYPRPGDAPLPPWLKVVSKAIGGVVGAMLLMMVFVKLLLMMPNAHKAPLAGAGMLFVLAPFGIYLLPSIVASRRSHPNVLPIAVVNIFLGWSLIGWVVALAWSLTAIPAQQPPQQ